MIDPDLHNLLADFDIIIGNLESLRQCFAGDSDAERGIATQLDFARFHVLNARLRCEQETRP